MRDGGSSGAFAETTTADRRRRLLRAAPRRPGSTPLVPLLPLPLHQLPLLLLAVLHVDEGGDEGVLHLLLKVQLISQGQLLHQLLREPPDVRLRPLQMLIEAGDAQTPQPWGRTQKSA